jgi:mono/diheme cytochrome c family protein
MLFGVIVAVSTNALTPAAAEDTKDTKDTKQVTYVKDVEPILSASCVGCHGSNKKKAGVDVSSYTNVMKIVKTEKPDDSRLYKCVAGVKGVKKMPPKNPLESDQIATIKTWISTGAKEK